MSNGLPKGPLPGELWNAIDAYVHACGGNPEAFPNELYKDDETLTARLRAALREWAIAEITEALKGQT